MDFLKSVFSEETSSSSEPSDHQNDPQSANEPELDSQNPNPKIPSVANAWAFGSTLFKSIATKSESLIENYKRDIEDFSSGLRKETGIVRQAATRAVKDLPARLEAGAAVAQTGLESVGQAIDNLGSTVSVMITHGRDSIFNPDDEDSDDGLIENYGSESAARMNNSKPYSRIDAVIRAIQCNMKTYCEEVEEVEEYGDWKRGFVLEERNGEIEDLVKENGVIGEIYDEVVPGRVDRETFWSRYFYRIYRVMKAEEARAKLVRRAMEGEEEEEELSWDVDDEDENSGYKSKMELRKEVEIEKKVLNLKLVDGREGEEGSKARMRNDDMREENGVLEGRLDENEMSVEKVGIGSGDEKVSSEGRNDNVSEFSVVSSQPSSHEEDDLGWDEIEDIGSGDDGKAVAQESLTAASLKKRLSAAEEDEDLTWDIEDDEEPIKSS